MTELRDNSTLGTCDLIITCVGGACVCVCVYVCVCVRACVYMWLMRSAVQYLLHSTGRASFRGGGGGRSFARHSPPPPPPPLPCSRGNFNPSKLTTAHYTHAPTQNVFQCAFAPAPPSPLEIFLNEPLPG